MTLPLLTDQKESPRVTFAEPDDSQSFASSLGSTIYKYGYGALVDPIVNPQAYKDIFNTAERSTRLTGNMVSETASREEAYDRRIAAVKKATGIDLQNPERGGYATDARKAIRDEVRAGGLQPIDAKGGIPEYQQRIFEQKLAELQKDHPDLDFGSLDAEARTLAKGAADAAAKAASADVNPVASLATQFAGGLVGSRRDPLFIGSMFAGPTSAVGRTAFARIATSSLFSGLFNAGVSAFEQPAVQDWRAKIGMESGVIPAAHEVGMAFLLGMIPGALIQGGKEALSAPLRRVLAGHPEPGDVEAIRAGLTPDAPREAAALASGAESTAADRATLTIPEPKGIAPELHDDMLAAALKRADDPMEPAPEAVQLVREIAETPEAERYSTRGGTRHGLRSEAMEVYREQVRARVDEAAPKSEREAIAVADEALDDIGRREGMAALRESIEAAKPPAGQSANRVGGTNVGFGSASMKAYRETLAARGSSTDAGEEMARAFAARVEEKPPRGDPIGKIPWVDDEGRPKLLTAKAAAAIGEKDDLFAMLVRSCK